MESWWSSLSGDQQDAILQTVREDKQVAMDKHALNNAQYEFVHASFLDRASPSFHIMELRKQADTSLLHLKAITSVLVVLHLIASVVMMMMAFLDNADQNSDSNVSTSIVVCAFASLVASLWVTVTLYEVINVPRQRITFLPKWEWHHWQVVKGLFVMFVLVFSLVPACVIFLLQQELKRRNPLLSSIRSRIDLLMTENLNVFILIVSELLSALGVGLTAIASIIYCSTTLMTLGAPMMTNASALDLTNTAVKIPGGFKIIAGLKLVFDLLFFIVQILIIVVTRGNSGPVVSLILSTLNNLPFLYVLIMIRRKDSQLLDLLKSWRQFSVIQLFCTYIEFWMCFVVLMLSTLHTDTSGGSDTGFFAEASKNLPARSQSLVGLCLALLVTTTLSHGFAFYCHFRCIIALDRISQSEQPTELLTLQPNSAHQLDE